MFRNGCISSKLKKNVFWNTDENDKEMKTMKGKMNDLEDSEFLFKLTIICAFKKKQEHLKKQLSKK